MTLLENIINELVDNKISLSAPLLKTKVLATRIDNQPLLKWTNNELTGYSNVEELPPYRIHFGNVYGTYINGRWQFNNQALPTMDLPDTIQDFYNKFDFLQSIETLETLTNENGQGVVSTAFTAEQIGLLEHYIKKKGNPYLQIISAHKQIPANTITQILSVVRSQLLDFMLEVEKTFGSEVDIKTLKDNKKELVTIMNHTINNNGDGNIINTGADTTIKAKINVVKNDKQSLVDALKEQKVSEVDITSLTSIIDDEKPIDNKTFGKKVQGWFGKMLTKSLDGTWEVSVATAGGLLTEIIKQYYGM